MPKISVILPVYNVEKYLRECLDSLVNQTLKDVEIICVDDGSTDESLKILNEYAARDGRIIVVEQPNKGAGAARNLGLMYAHGEYLAFVDPDDFIEPSLLSECIDAAEREDADIVSFRYVEFDSKTGSVKKNVQFPARIRAILSSGRITASAAELSDCIFTSVVPSVWSKIFRRKMIATENIVFQELRRANDLYFSYMAILKARKIAFIDRALYHYRKGIDSTSNLDCLAGNFFIGYRAIKKYLVDSGRYASVARDFIEKVSASLRYNINTIQDEKARLEAIPKLIAQYHEMLPIDEIVRFYGSLPPAVADILSKGSRDIKVSDMEKKVRTIGIACKDLSQGGIQRVVSILVPMFVRYGYRVVLLTTRGQANDVYHLDVPVERIVLGTESRGKKLLQAIKEHHIDLVIFHEYYSAMLVGDVAAIKSSGVPYIVHYHGKFSCFFRKLEKIDDEKQCRVFREAAALIVLSKAGEYYFRVLGANAHYLPNPVIDAPIRFVRDVSPKTILWMGRFVENKRPNDAILIFQEVLRKHPDAKLVMLGELVGKAAKQVQTLVAGDERLKAAVEFKGFQSDVWAYLSKTSILLTTSVFEGFPCTFVEASAAGVPTVGYGLPYLEIARDNDGYIQTPLLDTSAAAEAICRVFDDKSAYEKASRAARMAFERIKSVDQMAAYNRIFSEVLEGKRSAEIPSDEHAMVLRETVLDACWGSAELKRQINGCQQAKLKTDAELSKELKTVKKLRSDRDRKQKKIKDIANSTSYRVGLFITWPARKIWHAFRDNPKIYAWFKCCGSSKERYGSLENEVKIQPGKSSYRNSKFKDLLIPGASYRFSASSVKVFAGKSKKISVAIVDDNTSKVVIRKHFLLNSPKEWVFNIPKDKEGCSLRLYAGELGHTEDVGVIWKNVTLEQIKNNKSTESSKLKNNKHVDHTQIKVSVIIPVYNAAPFLEECVDSILTQDIEKEVILVDDCSTDDSYDLCCKLAKRDPRVKVVHNEVNRFAGVCRNIGTELATGEYLAYLDADDRLETGALVEFYRLAKEEDLDVLRGTATAFDHATGQAVPKTYYEQPRIKGIISRKPVDLLSDYREIVELAPVPWIGICRAAIVKEAGLKFNALRCSNDVSFFFDLMMAAKRIRFVRKRFAWHRINNKSSLMGVRAKNYRDVLKSLEIIADHASSLPLPVRVAIVEKQMSGFPKWLDAAINANEDSKKVRADFRKTFAELDFPISESELKEKKWYPILLKSLGPFRFKGMSKFFVYKQFATLVYGSLREKIQELANSTHDNPKV